MRQKGCGLPAGEQHGQRTARGLLLVLAAWGALALPRSAPAESFAERITPENAVARLVGGSDATGGIGDWALGNGVLCAVISDPSHESHLMPQGGVLIDLGRCGLAHDEWNTLEMLLNLSRDSMLGGATIRAETGAADGPVAVVVGARMLGLEIETRYRLRPERPEALEIETRATRLPEAPDVLVERAFLFGDVVLHGRRQLAPFSLRFDARARTVQAAGSVGFAHPAVDPDDLLTLVRAILPANLHVLVGGDPQRPGVAYGLHLVGARLEAPDGSSQPLPHLAINGEDFTMQGVFTRPFLVGGSDGVGWLELAQTILMDLEPGETLVFTRELLVGARADVASVTDQLWPDAPRVRGQCAPEARIHVTRDDGTPVTQARPDATGGFAFRLPPGRYRLDLRAHFGKSLSRELELAGADLDLGPLVLPDAGRPGRVLLPRGRPMRLVFVPQDGAEPPGLDDDLLGFRVGDVLHPGSELGRDVSLGGIDSDPARIALPAGRYRVLATRGPEWSLAESALQVAAGQDVALQIDDPVRELDHAGWLAADLHVHSEWSDDSSYRIDRQLAAFAAEGADLLVSTEHDRVVDYAPRIEALGLGDRMASLVGVEVTSSAHTAAAPRTAGHANVYPLPFSELAFRGGAPRGEGRRLRAMMDEVRALPGERIVQLNHPRSSSGRISDLNLFTHLSVAGEPFLPERPLSEWPNRVLLEREPASGTRDLDFDVMELANGSSMRQYRAVRADWYALLLQGERRTAVANSDSHVRSELIAYPRTYVAAPEGGSFLASLRAGHAYGSSGPLLELELAGEDGNRAGIGGTLAGDSGRLHVRVRAASWVPVSALRVWWNGEPVHSGSIAPGTPVALPLRFVRDGFLTVEVSGVASGDYALIAPGFEPFAFSNPIFVDADRDGGIAPPGLPAARLEILAPEP